MILEIALGIVIAVIVLSFLAEIIVVGIGAIIVGLGLVVLAIVVLVAMEYPGLVGGIALAIPTTVGIIYLLDNLNKYQKRIFGFTRNEILIGAGAIIVCSCIARIIIRTTTTNWSWSEVSQWLGLTGLMLVACLYAPKVYTTSHAFIKKIRR